MLALAARAKKIGVPMLVIKVTLNTWRGPRFIRLGRMLNRVPIFAACGLPAGSGLNDIFVRAWCIEPLDSFVVKCPHVSFDQAVDDSVVPMEPTADLVSQEATEGGCSLPQADCGG